MSSIKDIWNSYVNGNATIEDKKALIEAIDKKNKELDELFLNGWEGLEDLDIDQDKIHQAKTELLKELGLEEKRTSRFSTYRIAAGVLILIGLSLVMFFSNRNDMIRIEVASGKQIEQVVLPDGSRIWINNGSTLTYSKDFLSTNTRKVNLLGNAFFDVKRDTLRPFVIETGKLNVRVLGTSFDVYCYQDELSRVTVKSGKVEVSHTDSGSKIQLVKNEQSQYDQQSNRLQKIKTDSNMSIVWRDNVLQFENVELRQVLKRVERKYGVKINCPDTLLLKSRIRASYKNEPLDTILSDLAFMINFDYTKNEKTNEITLKTNSYEKIE